MLFTHNAAKFLTSLLARIIPLSIAFLATVYSSNDNLKMTAYFIGICVLIAAEYFGNFRPLQNLDDLRKKQIDHWVKPFITSAQIGDRKATIRVNVMIAKWYWFQKHFFQYYQCAMSGYSDANLHFPVSSGVCGKAFGKESSELTYRDLRCVKQKERKSFKLFPKAVEATSHIKAIACIPLYREVKTFNGIPRQRFFGVLNVDAVDDEGAELLKDLGIQKQIKALAGFVQLTML